MGLNLKIETSSPNIFRIVPSDVSSKLMLQGDFNYPIIAYGTNIVGGGGGSSYDGGKTWIDASLLSYAPTTTWTYLEGGNVGGYTNLSSNGKDVMIWSWPGSASIKHLSNDGGRTWTSTYYGGTTNFRWTHWNKNTNNAYIGGWSSANQARKSTDNGVTLTTLSTGYTTLNFDSADDESYVYGANSNTQNIVISTDQGSSWTAKTVGSGEGDHRVVKCDATGQYVVVYYGNATSHQCSCYVSRDYAATFDAAAPSSAYARVAMTRDAAVIVYDAFADASLFLSNNQGVSWYSVISPFDTSVVFFSEDYVNNTIYAWSRGYNRVYKLNDEKNNFNLFTILDNSVFSFNTSQYGRGFLYSYNIGDTGTFFSRNGQTWEKIRDTAPVYLMVF